ncbi:MAG: resolvase [Shimia thalassica]|uniref:resolvase n=1 Tax=Shimia thalassica TaxID=1715693 RepID=UPI003298D66C
MSDENETVVDLFGNEVYKLSRKKGRPAFEWTEENSNKVSMLLAAGWSNDRIAGCVLDPRNGKPICVKTLQRHFRRELSVRDSARDMLMAKRFMEVSKACDDGNVGAMRLMDQLMDKNDMMLAASRLRNAQGETGKDKSERLGKKEQEQRRAKEVAETKRSGWGNDLNPSAMN